LGTRRYERGEGRGGSSEWGLTLGTSSDYEGPRGGAWTPYKYAVTNYAKHGGERRLERVLARHVATLGGASAAVAASGSAVGGAQRLGGVISGIATDGLGPTLERFGLGHLVGQGRFEVLEALLALVAGPGGDLEAEAARQAACDVIESIFGDAETFDELDSVVLDADSLISFLESFIGLCVFYRILPQLADRLTKYSNPLSAASLEREMKEFIHALVQLNLAGRDPLVLDWEGAEGAAIIDEVVRGAYRHMESLE
jgi:hypothetical protein